MFKFKDKNYSSLQYTKNINIFLKEKDDIEL